ncbi:MAG: cupin domain-containing protein [Candidatus Competibacteraceae bacterium]|nr:MAG: cupin domain-containing protein [Candidatus Competibacteraceae bacterium]
MSNIHEQLVDSLSDAEPGFDLGTRLRAVREQYGLSQRELARRAGVTNGTISLIEQNKNSPSVASLKKVLDGIPLSLSEFFSLEPPSQDPIFFKAHELLELAKGAISFRQVGRNLRHRKLQILHERYAPGADTGKLMLQHDGEEGGIVLRGRIEIMVGDQRRVLEAEDAYYFDSRQPHRFRNVGDQECELISVCTPPSF